MVRSLILLILLLATPLAAEDKFVCSYSAWPTQYASLVRDWKFETNFNPAIDTVYVCSNHDEVTASEINISGTSALLSVPQVKIRCVTPGSMESCTSAKVRTTGTGAVHLHLNNSLDIKGIQFISAGNLWLGKANDDNGNYIVCEDCTLEITDTSQYRRIAFGQSAGGIANFIHLKNPTIRFGGQQQGFEMKQGHFRIDGGILETSTNYMFDFTSGAGRTSIIWINGLDATAFTGTVVESSAIRSDMEIHLVDVLLGNNVVLHQGEPFPVPGVTIEQTLTNEIACPECLECPQFEAELVLLGNTQAEAICVVRE